MPLYLPLWTFRIFSFSKILIWHINLTIAKCYLQMPLSATLCRKKNRKLLFAPQYRNVADILFNHLSEFEFFDKNIKFLIYLDPLLGFDMLSTSSSSHELLWSYVLRGKVKTCWRFFSYKNKCANSWVCCLLSSYFEGHMVLTFSDSGELTGWSGEPILLDNSVPKVKFLSLRGFLCIWLSSLLLYVWSFEPRLYPVYNELECTLSKSISVKIFLCCLGLKYRLFSIGYNSFHNLVITFPVGCCKNELKSKFI